MAPRRDYYEVLQVPREADGEEIKKAYRRLAVQCHPDRNPGDKDAEERFKELSEAFSVLCDGDKRQRYDQFGFAGLAGVPGANDFASSFSDVFSDLFSDFFGVSRPGRRGRGARGEDLRYRLGLTFEEAAFGVEKPITYPRLVECGACLGDGIEAGHAPVECKVCAGRGEVRFQQAFLVMSRTCPNCGGRGKIVEKPCARCKGEGRAAQERTITVRVPPGVGDGTRLRLRQEGDSGMGGAEGGDLFVQIEILPHPLFSREGDSVVCDLPLRMETAALGGTVQVPTLDGVVDLKVPSGTQTGEIFSIKGKGIPRLQGSGRGDHFVRVTVEVPSRINRAQRRILEDFAREGKDGAYKAVSEYERKLSRLKRS